MKDFFPLVSIIIPVYNGANYMREAIDSAIAQTYKNIEIIVINDGSNDDGETEKIAKEYGNKIRYICKPNGGVSTALNLGIKNMRGEYFSWLSHDDVYMSDKIEKQINALSELDDKQTLVYCQSVYIDKNSDLIKKMPDNNHVAHLDTWDEALMGLFHKYMNGCAFLIHKSVFEDVGLFDEHLRFNQDGFMWNKIFLGKYSLLTTPDVCVKLRMHAGQLTLTGQELFQGDCEQMSEFLIPELINISTKEKNFILAYIKYHAKYKNKKIVDSAYTFAKRKGLVSFWNRIEIVVWSMYGFVRPSIRRIYYKMFK
jgi:glycosyltransferase involved in cell wall biosynthesis